MRYARLPSVALLVFCGWFAAGCVNDENGLSIVHFVHRDLMTNCAADPASMSIDSSGIFDAATAALTGVGFLLSPVVVNNLIVATTTTSPVNTIFLTGFDIELKPDAADAAVAAALPPANRKFHLPAAGGQIFPGGGAQPMASSEAAVTLEVLNSEVAKLLVPSVADGERDPLALTVHLRPVGTHSGVVINGGWVDFPIFVCNHCLTPAPKACPQAGFAPADVLKGCNPAQEPETCCTDTTTGVLKCGASVPMKAM